MRSDDERREVISLDSQEGRYSRLEMISWWDQRLLREAKVMVVGAGALGNEIIKNLALIGVGRVLIVDFDVIEESNLSRSVLYRSDDGSRSKASTAAEAARKINPDCEFIPLNADVTRQVGAGLFRWADVVICGLDNREARLAVNSACWRVTRPWVDGATESFQGVARVFAPPDGACYECTLSEQDRKFMAVRNSCGFIAREAVRQGGTPTTPTTSAVIAGIEVQEAIKLLHTAAGRDDCPPALAGRGFFFDGVTYDCFTIDYTRRDDCLGHETFDNIVETDLASDTATLADVLAIAERHIGEGVVIDLPSDMITGLRCTECGTSTELFRLLNAVNADEAACPGCGKLRVPEVESECSMKSSFASIPLKDLGLGLMEILPARRGELEVQVELSGDMCILK